ncbi:MAG: N-acetylmuramoyl-L-alanine amidase [Saprospirales bacterium]|nr:MAG: N-acetylmuramoyl-L-alanine amidase [Saprospirales bacterium]
MSLVKTTKWVISSVLLLFLQSLGATTEVQYLEAEARAGDGIIVLLQRYGLHQHECNYDKFYQLNQLRHNQALHRGRTYKLPIAVKEYNGNNIRSTIGIDDWDQAVAIQQYNERQLSRGNKTKDYRTGGKLWVPHHLMECYRGEPEVVQASVRSINEPIFGPNHAEVVLKSNMLNGRAFYLKSGHGGPDPGAIGSYNGHNICEDEYAYDVTLRLARRLMEHGASVFLIVQDPYDGIRDDRILLCDNTEMHYGNRRIPANQLARLRERSQIINQLYRQNRAKGYSDHVMVSVHIDSRPENQRQDVFFYHYNNSRKGRQVAQNLQNVFRQKYSEHRPSRPYRGTVSGRNLFVLRTTHPPAVLIELANIRNSNDLMRVILPSNRQALADWMFEGLAGFSP